MTGGCFVTWRKVLTQVRILPPTNIRRMGAVFPDNHFRGTAPRYFRKTIPGYKTGRGLLKKDFHLKGAEKEFTSTCSKKRKVIV